MLELAELQPLMLLLLLMRAPRALGGGASERQHRVGREDSEWGLSTTEGTLSEDSQCSTVCRVSTGRYTRAG